MKKLLKLFNKPQANRSNINARARMERSMPGEAAALASLRYGGMSI